MRNGLAVALTVLVAAVVLKGLSNRIRKIVDREVDLHVIWSTILFLSAFLIQQIAAGRHDPEVVEACYMGLLAVLTTLGVFSTARAIELRHTHHAEHALDVLREIDVRQSSMVTWEFLSPTTGERLSRIAIPAEYGVPRPSAYPEVDDFLMYRDGILVYDGGRAGRPLIAG